MADFRLSTINVDSVRAWYKMPDHLMPENNGMDIILSTVIALLNGKQAIRLVNLDLNRPRCQITCTDQITMVWTLFGHRNFSSDREPGDMANNPGPEQSTSQMKKASVKSRTLKKKPSMKLDGPNNPAAEPITKGRRGADQ